MRFITDEPINFCPKCGRAYPSPGGYERQDFYAGCSHQCSCGTQYQYVPVEAIKETAAQHGDASQYWD